MSMLKMTTPKKTNLLDRIHPDHEDQEYFDKHLAGDISTEEWNKGYDSVNEFRAMIKGLNEDEIDSKIAQIKGALYGIDNSITAQKYTRAEHTVDAVMAKTCHTKKRLEEMLHIAEEGYQYFYSTRSEFSLYDQ
ncbi:MAG: hypothetical protein IAE93_08660 [Ignavibacteria bacterium]|nr:hypothetical protein [Ignavibacteria bacterium]